MHPLSFLPYLRAFDAVAQHGSVRAASEELGLSPGAVSLQLRKLSEVTGLEFWEKSGRGIRLNPAGRAFARTVEQSLTDLKRGLQDASVGTGEPSRQPLRVSVPPSLGSAWMAGAMIETVRRAGPNRLFVRTGMQASEIDWDETDLAVVYDNPPFPGLWWQLLSDVVLQPVCSPTLLPRLERRRHPRRLGAVTLLHEDDGEEWARWAAEANVDIGEASHAYFASVALAQAAAVQGVGIALISNILTWSDVQQGRLIHPFRTRITASFAYYFLCPSEQAKRPAVRSMIDQVTDQVWHLRRQDHPSL